MELDRAVDPQDVSQEGLIQDLNRSRNFDLPRPKSRDQWPLKNREMILCDEVDVIWRSLLLTIDLYLRKSPKQNAEKMYSKMAKIAGIPRETIPCRHTSRTLSHEFRGSSAGLTPSQILLQRSMSLSQG
jgi:hypothetical protein